MLAIHDGLQTDIKGWKSLVLALFIISRKLKYYFQTFLIIVLTEQPLRSDKADTEMGIRTETLWTQIWAEDNNQGQVLADFIADFTPGVTE